MNSTRPSPKSGICAICVICGCLLSLSCLKLDSFLFDPITMTGEYLQMSSADSAKWHVRGIIPDSLVEPETLYSLDSNRVYGFYVRRPGSDGEESTAATVIYNHGRGENINRYWGRVELLWEAGCNVFIYDYEGYGKSEGSPSGPACYADADAALDYVRSRPDAVDSMIVYYGWSLGSCMACHLAADNDTFKPRCIILENPLASTSALAQEGAVLAIPGSFVADADFDNASRMRFLGRRTLIIYGEEDDTAVPERHALVLLDKAYGSITATGYPVPGAKHDDLPEKMGYDEYEEVMKAYIAGDSL